jgi:MFS family permease
VDSIRDTGLGVAEAPPPLYREAPAWTQQALDRPRPRPASQPPAPVIWMSTLRSGGHGVRVFYGWIIAGTILTVWCISIGPRQSFSIFLLPLIEEFGSSRSAVAATFSLHMAFYALGGWGLGILLDKVGPKRIIAWSTAGWGLVLVATSRLDGLWQLYLVYGVLGGVCTGGLAYVANNTLISRWFVRYRGLASGLAQAGVPLGMAIYAPLGQYGISTVGWRNTHLAFGLGVLLLAVPLILLV